MQELSPGTGIRFAIVHRNRDVGDEGGDIIFILKE
jgi:hypothetical protein